MKKWKIGTKLLFFNGLLLFLSFLIVGIVFSNTSYKASQKEKIHEMAATVSLLGESLDSWIQGRYEVLETMASRKLYQDVLMTNTRLSESHESFRVMTKHPSFENIFLLNTSGEVVSAADQSIMGSNYSSQKLFHEIMNSNRTYYIDSDIRLSGKTPVFAMSFALKNPSGQTIGVIGSMINWDSFANEFIAPIKIGKTGYATITDQNYRNLYHPNKELLLKDLSKLSFVRDMVDMKDGSLRYAWEGQYKVTVFHTHAQTGWNISLGVYEADLLEYIIKIRQLLLYIAIGIFVVMILLFKYLSSIMISSPLKSFMETFEQGAKGDLTAKIRIDRQDELGLLADSFNHFISNIHALVSEIQSSSLTLAASSAQMAQSSEEIARGIEGQASTSEELSSTITEISSNTEEVAANTEQVVASVHEINSHVETLKIGGEEVMHHMESMNQQSHETSKIAEQGLKSIQQNNQTMQHIADSSEIINERMDAVVDIAEQIKLLALNAAIVAAQAGEHGRGFSVVADAINNLAQQAGKTAAEITAMAQKNQQTAKDGLSVSQETLVMMQKISERAAQASQISEQVRAGIQTNVDNTNSIVTAVTEIARNTEQVSMAMRQQAEAINQLMEASESLAMQAANSTENVTEISETSNNLRSMSESLKDLAEQFQISHSQPTGMQLR